MPISVKQGKIMSIVSIAKTDLLCNEDGSIYHLRLQPEEIAKMIILVGDPARVPQVSQHFDKITCKKQNREFVTHTGYLGKQSLSVISTGIGVGNIDIVINEIDALHNIDLKKRQIKAELCKLKFIRLGTCGGLQAKNSPGSLILSTYAMAFDGLLNFYKYQLSENEQGIYNALRAHFKDLRAVDNLYLGKAAQSLIEMVDPEEKFAHGMTLTCPGFYGAQGRKLRLPLIATNLLDVATQFNYAKQQIINLEMETAAIYGLANLLGHEALSISTIVANRATGEPAENPKQAVNDMIACVLQKIA